MKEIPQPGDAHADAGDEYGRPVEAEDASLEAEGAEERAEPTRGPPWRRVLTEGAVIVMSILLAFGVDAWWDARQDRREVAAMAATLAVEIEEASRRLDGAIGVHVGAMCNARSWLSVTSGTPLDSVARIVNRATFHRTPNLSLSAVEGVLSSGQLATIRDDDLRTWISAWPGVREDFDEEMDGVIHFVRFIVPEYFVSRDLAREAAWSPNGIAADDVPEGRPLIPGETLRALVADPGFRSLMSQAYDVHEVFVREGRQVRIALAEGEVLARAAAGLDGRARGEAGREAAGAYAGVYEPTPETRREREASGNEPGRPITIAEGPVLEVADQSLALLSLGSDTFLAPGAGRQLAFDREDGEIAGLTISDYRPCEAGGPGRSTDFVREN